MDAVRKLRTSAEMTYRELSERLSDLGRKIPELGLSRLERGERRADADDLTALALALESTPNALMLPEISRPTVAARFELTPLAGGTPAQLWEWAQGEVPLRTPLKPIWDDEGAHRLYHFLSRGKPYLLAEGAAAADRIARRPGDLDRLALLEAVATAAEQALNAGLTGTDVRLAAELAISRSLLPRGE
jgi:transcriptional regulator with XRE-family HTH domain